MIPSIVVAQVPRDCMDSNKVSSEAAKMNLLLSFYLQNVFRGSKSCGGRAVMSVVGKKRELVLHLLIC